jgi:uncharacterized protein YegL
MTTNDIPQRVSQGSPPILPVCITIDVSQSMQNSGSIDALNAALPDLKQMMIDEPLVAEMTRVGIVIFNEEADTAVPLTDLTDIDMPELAAIGGTLYQSALSKTREFLAESINSFGAGVQFYTPIVFFLTDGLPLDDESEWLSEVEALKSGKYRANVVCFGFADADAKVLTKIGRTFLWRDSDPINAVRSIFASMIGSIKTTSMSAQAGKPLGIQFPDSIRDEADLFMEIGLNEN